MINMGAKITQAQIGSAVGKLALPGFVLKEVKEHQKAFEDAVSSYRRKFFFNRKFQESKETLQSRLNYFESTALAPLTTIYTIYKTYGLDQKGGKAKKNGNKIQTIVADAEKKLKALKTTLPGYEFNSADIKAEVPTGADSDKVVPIQKVKECEGAKRIFDAAVKKFGTASFFSKRLDPGEHRFIDLLKDAQVHIGCIYAAEDYYSETVGFQSLEKIANSVRKTVVAIQHDNGGAILFDDSKPLTPYLNPVPFSSSTEQDRITAVCFKVLDVGYAADYENFLTETIELYTTAHDSISSQKKQTKFDVSRHKVLDDSLHDTHVFLKKLQGLKNIKGELDRLIAENPKYGVALKRSLSKINSLQLPAAVSHFENQFQTLSYTTKYGIAAGDAFRNIDAHIDAFAVAIENFIIVFSSPKSSIDQCLKAIAALNEAEENLRKVPEFDAVKQTLNAEGAKKYAKKLDKIAMNVTAEIDKWNELYEDFQEALAKYREETSIAKKAVQVAQIVILVGALAAGAAQISASFGDDGLKISTTKTTK